MRLEHSFTVPAPIAQAWDVLLDVPRIAPCMPGAELGEFDGERFGGTVKVKVGPITLTYRGRGRFATIDEAARRAVIEASGRETRGSGTASAVVTAELRETLAGGGRVATRVEVTTELTMTGRPAQFGRSVIADVGEKLLGQFAACLEQTLATAPGPAPSHQDIPDVRDVPEPATSKKAEDAGTVHGAEPIDLLAVTGARRAARRYGPYVLVAAVAAVGVRLLVRRGR